MPKVTFITGLPGSGKSHYANEIQSTSGKEMHIFDDYKKHSNDNDPTFSKSKYYKELIKNLRSGRDCIVTDVDFYKSASRQQAEDSLIAEVGKSLNFDWVFFEKNIEACVQNVCYRAWNGKKQRSLSSIGKILVYAVVGDIPSGTDIRLVWFDKQCPKIPQDAFPNEKLLDVFQSLNEGIRELEIVAQSSPLDWANAFATLRQILNSFNQQFRAS